MSFLEAVVLGIVQGVGEFLPISSSAHLVLVPWLLGWSYAGLAFDVALHIGTLLAIVSFFWKDWLVLLVAGFGRAPRPEKKLFWYVVIATIPGAFFGYLLEEQAETVFREPLVVGVMLVVMGIVLYLADSRVSESKKMAQMGIMDSILIGVSQALAIIPGVSRAGITMTTGRFLGMHREDAARFSFLLSAPIIFGAGLAQLGKVTPSQMEANFFVGIAVSAIIGFISIGFLLRYLARHSFVIFVWYRLFLGGIVIILALFN